MLIPDPLAAVTAHLPIPLKLKTNYGGVDKMKLDFDECTHLKWIILHSIKIQKLDWK